MGEVEPLDDPRVTTGICPECLVEFRVDATIYEVRRWRGVAALIIPGNREDLLLRVWRATRPEASFVVFPDRRRTQPEAVGATEEPRAPGERRRYRLSFVIPDWSVRRE